MVVKEAAFEELVQVVRELAIITEMRLELAHAKVEFIASQVFDKQLREPVVEDMIRAECAQVRVQRRLQFQVTVRTPRIKTHAKTADFEIVVVALVRVHIEIVDLKA